MDFSKYRIVDCRVPVVGELFLSNNVLGHVIEASEHNFPVQKCHSRYIVEVVDVSYVYDRSASAAITVNVDLNFNQSSAAVDRQISKLEQIKAILSE